MLNFTAPRSSTRPGRSRRKRGMMVTNLRRTKVDEGRKRPKRGVPNVANTQDSQERAPRAARGFLGPIQVPYEARVYNVGLPKCG
eukprot:606205-Prorocentrum_minimum.AAC.1